MREREREREKEREREREGERVRERERDRERGGKGIENLGSSTNGTNCCDVLLRSKLVYSVFVIIGP